MPSSQAADTEIAIHVLDTDTIASTSLPHQENVDHNQGLPSVRSLTGCFVALMLGTGPGILLLPSVFLNLGWIAGPVILLLMAVVTWYTSSLMTRVPLDKLVPDKPHSASSIETSAYKAKVSQVLGSRYLVVYQVAEAVEGLGTGLGGIVIGGIIAGYTQKARCYHNDPRDRCKTDFNIFFVIFGAVQIVLSHVPKGSRLAMTAAFSVLVIGYTVGSVGLLCKELKDSADISSKVSWLAIGAYMQATSSPQVVYDVFSSVGSAAYAFSFGLAFTDVQDTIGYSPEANSRVSKAIAWALSIVALCYVTFGCLGSAPFALSKYVPVITVDGLLGSDPQWLLDVVLICILLLVCGFYQVELAETTESVELFVEQKLCKSPVLHKPLRINLFWLPVLDTTLFGIIWRTSYVSASTVMAMLVPFAVEILSISGSIQLFLVTIFLPVQMHIKQNAVKSGSRSWMALQLLNLCSFCITLAAVVASIVSVKQGSENFHAFDNTF